MNALWDIASERPEIGLASYLQEKIHHILAENDHLRQEFLRAPLLKPRNPTHEIQILEQIKCANLP
jgi:hypothetical protein